MQMINILDSKLGSGVYRVGAKFTKEIQIQHSLGNRWCQPRAAAFPLYPPHSATCGVSHSGQGKRCLLCLPARPCGQQELGSQENQVWSSAPKSNTTHIEEDAWIHTSLFYRTEDWPSEPYPRVSSAGPGWFLSYYPLKAQHNVTILHWIPWWRVGPEGTILYFPTLLEH